MAVIEQLVLSYPDFVHGNVMDSEQFDQNNLDICTKVNEVVSAVNSHSEEITIVDGKVDTAIANANKAKNDADIAYDGFINLSNTLFNDYYNKEYLASHFGGGDTDTHIEVYTIINTDNGDGTFTYANIHGIETIASLGVEGEQLFYLTDGEYLHGRDRIEIIINDTLHRTAKSGGLQEVETGDAVVLTSPEGVGAEITIKYFSRVAIAGEYSLIMSETLPPLTYDDKMWFKVVG